MRANLITVVNDWVFDTMGERIGFIGAGTIIFRKAENIVSGLTTAAGLWVTAAIGLACGGGMYVLSIASTLMVLVGLEAFNYLLRKIDKRRKTNS